MYRIGLMFISLHLLILRVPLLNALAVDFVYSSQWMKQNCAWRLGTYGLKCKYVNPNHSSLKQASSPPSPSPSPYPYL